MALSPAANPAEAEKKFLRSIYCTFHSKCKIRDHDQKTALAASTPNRAKHGRKAQERNRIRTRGRCEPPRRSNSPWIQSRHWRQVRLPAASRCGRRGGIRGGGDRAHHDRPPKERCAQRWNAGKCRSCDADCSAWYTARISERRVLFKARS